MDFRGSAIETEEYSHSDTNFNIAFGLQMIQGYQIDYPIDESHLNLSATLVRDEGSGGPVELGFHQCTSTDRDNFYEQALDGDYPELENDFLSLYCLNEPS